MVLTGDSDSWIPIHESERSYFAAVSEDDPPTSAYILFTKLRYPARLKAQLRESLRQRGVSVLDQIEVSPSELENVYASSTKKLTRADSNDIDFKRGRDVVQELLAKAVSENASDIHIVRRRISASVSFRVDGRIVPHANWTEHMADQTCRFIYEVMGYDQQVTWNRHEPQDAVVDTALPQGKRVRVRVGTIPASPDGYDMVLRMLPGSDDIMKLSQLGYHENQIKALNAITKRPSGLVVMAGSVGSGKSTSIVSMLHEELAMHQHQLRIITVEDPPEHLIYGATQVPVIRKRGSTPGAEDEFSFAIRGALRCDPDTLMVGEIRDLQSALLTVKFAQSGHRVYTTVHASNAIGIISRLIGLGIDPVLLCTPGVIKGLVYQSLVPTLCIECRVSAEVWQHNNSGRNQRFKSSIQRVTNLLATRKLETKNVHYRSDDGCKKCYGSGVSGRTVMAEIVIPDDEMLDYLSSCNYRKARLHWIENLNGQPAIEHGIQLIAAGKVAPPDIEWYIGSFDEISPINTNISITNHTNKNTNGNSTFSFVEKQKTNSAFGGLHA